MDLPSISLSGLISKPSVNMEVFFIDVSEAGNIVLEYK
jgi:hypothetical protein